MVVKNCPLKFRYATSRVASNRKRAHLSSLFLKSISNYYISFTIIKNKQRKRLPR